MAIYFLDMKRISRQKGQSVVASAAYRSGDRLFSDEDGRTKNYTKKQKEVKYSEILLPEHAPREYKDRETLWNAVEKKERRADAQLAREIVVALPNELTLEQQKKLLQEYTREKFVNDGMIADISIHDKKDGNPHAHILLTMRPMNERGEWGDRQKKIYILDKNGNKIYNPKTKTYKCTTEKTTNWDEPETLEKWREGWATITNKHLERSGHEQRIDHRSYEKQGSYKLATVHLGVEAAQLEKRGQPTERGNKNRAIEAQNAKNQADLLRAKRDKETDQKKAADQERAAIINAQKNFAITIEKLEEQEKQLDAEFFRKQAELMKEEAEQTRQQTVDLAADERPATTKPTEERQPEKTLEEKLAEIETGLTRDDRHNAEQATAAKELGKKHIDGYYDTNNKIFKRTKQVQFTAERNAEEKKIDKQLKECDQELIALGKKPFFGGQDWQAKHDEITQRRQRLQRRKENLDKELEIRLKTDGNVDSRIYQEVKEKTLAEMTPEQRQEYQRGKAILETVGRIEKKALEIRHENEKAKKPQKEKTLDRGGRGL